LLGFIVRTIAAHHAASSLDQLARELPAQHESVSLGELHDAEISTVLSRR
jgi:hypothetical protein